MDFARKQLEKYGWTDGKGLGRHENGISEALKPKLKRSVTGIGHDPASEFNEHWWTALYDKAAGNIVVKEKNNKTKKIKTNASDFEITNSTWKLKNNNNKSNEKYAENFVRTAVLTNGGSKTENVKEAADEQSQIEKKDIFQMTDEELFKACEGRTAHKGARHGLKALGKLARVAMQEEILLNQPQYSGYQRSKKTYVKEEVVENISLDSEKEVKNKKKKKKKRCFSSNDTNVIELAENSAHVEVGSVTVQNEFNVGIKRNKEKESVASVEIQDGIGREANGHKRMLHIEECVEFQNIDKTKKKKKRKNVENNDCNDIKLDCEVEDSSFVKKSKKCK